MTITIKRSENDLAISLRQHPTGYTKERHVRLFENSLHTHFSTKQALIEELTGL